MTTNITYKHKNYTYRNILILIFLGSLTSFSLPPYNYFFFNFVTFPALFLLLSLKRNTKYLTFFYGWIFGFSYFLCSLYWIVESLTFEEQFKKFIPLAIFLVPAFLGLFYGIATLVMFFLRLKRDISSLLLFVIIFGFIEYIRASILTGFPWNLFVYSISNLKNILQVLSFTGTYSLNLLIITLYLLPAIFFFKINKKSKKLYFSIVIIFLISFFYFSYSKTSFNNSFVEKKLDLQIKIISPNFSLQRYFKEQDPTKRIIDLINLSNPKKNEKTIFIYPEGILSSIYLNDLNKYEFLFKDNFSEKHQLIIGINSQDGLKIFNSLILVDNKLKIKNKYDKNYLVPFGEFLPLENLLSKFGLKKITQGYQSFSSSNERKVIVSNEIKILPLICYEIIYSGKLNTKNENYDIILNISEDGWFGNSIGPHQHFVHSIFRSIEERKTLIRSSNNGISAIIDPIDGVLKKIDSTSTGVISLNSLKIYDKSFFSIYGNKIFFYLLVFYISLFLILKKKNL